MDFGRFDWATDPEGNPIRAMGSRGPTRTGVSASRRTTAETDRSRSKDQEMPPVPQHRHVQIQPAAPRTSTDLPLPEAVVDAALDVDGEGAMAGDLHRRMGDHTACLHRRGDSRFDVIHQPVGSHNRLLVRAQGRPFWSLRSARPPGNGRKNG